MQIDQLVDGAKVSWWEVVVISVPITLIIVILLAIRLNKFCRLKNQISEWKMRSKPPRKGRCHLFKRSKKREIGEEIELV
jgi:uncharacterized protein HemY